MTCMRYGEKIVRLCDALGWSQADLWRSVNAKRKVSRQTVSSWFNEASRPDMDHALAVAQALDVSLDWLANDEMNWPPPSVEKAPDEEVQILEMYRSLKRRGRIDMDRAIEGLAIAAAQASRDSNDEVVAIEPERFPIQERKRSGGIK